MRGEDNRLILADLDVVGSPPHARGRRGGGRRGSRLDRDHPRMRGEDDGLFEFDNEPVGSPPHARGRLHPRLDLGDRLGITPACAGKTLCTTDMATSRWDHPRMRGEDVLGSEPHELVAGSPPHARGRHHRQGLRQAR